MPLGISKEERECLETRVLPKLIGRRCRNWRRNKYIAHLAGYQIGQDQTVDAWTHDFHFDVCHRGATRVWMNFQRLTHMVLVAVKQPQDEGRDSSGLGAVKIDRERPVCIYWVNALLRRSAGAGAW